MEQIQNSNPNQNPNQTSSEDKIGENIFTEFVKTTPEGISEFDYFHLLDHISQNKIDKDLIAAIFCESKIGKFINHFYYFNKLKIILGNKPFE